MSSYTATIDAQMKPYLDFIELLGFQLAPCATFPNAHLYTSPCNGYCLDIFTNSNGCFLKVLAGNYHFIFNVKSIPLTSAQTILDALLRINYPPAVALHRQRMLALLCQ